MSSCPSIKSLPMELIHLVCELLDPHDLLAARFISRDFAAAGIAHVMSTVSFALAPTSVQRLEDVSKHPIWSKLVKVVEYEMDSPSHFRDPRDANFLVRRRGGSPNPLLHFEFLPRPDFLLPPVYRGNALEYYRSIVSYRHDLKTNRDERQEMLTRILARFTNLRSLRCVGIGASRSKNSAFSLYNLARFTERVGSTDGVQQLGDIMHITAHNQQLASLSRSDPQHQGTSRHPRLQDRAPLTSLAIELVAWSRFAELMRSEYTMSNSAKALEHLTTLKMGIHLSRSPSSDPGLRNLSDQEFTLLAFLALAPKLQSLSLVFQHAKAVFLIPSKIKFRITHAIGPLTWSNLRNLHLDTIQTEQNGLMKFLRQHAGTLKRLRLEKAVLRSGRWQDVVNEIVQVMSLETMFLSDVTEQDLGGGAACYPMDVECAKDGSFILHWPRYLRRQKIRIVLGDVQLGRVLLGGDNALARCAEWWAFCGDRKLGRYTGGEARMPTLHIR